MWVILLIALPLVVLLWATESQQQRRRRRARFMRHSSGLTYREIAEQLQVSITTARRYAN